MLLKGQKSLYRYVGIIGATFTIIQSCIWLPLSLHATMCYYHPYYVACGDVEKEKSFSRCFYLMYFQTDTNPYPNLIKPVVFNLLMWLCFIMTLVILFTSIRLLIAFCSWSKRKSIMKAEFIWTRVILICSFIEFILFIAFVADIISINNSDERDCLVSSNGTMPKHSQLGDLSYLEHIKATLEEMKMIVQNKTVDLKEMERNMTDIKSKNLFLTENLFNENDNNWRKMFGSPVINNTHKKFEKDDVDFINNFKEFLHISDDEIIDWDDADYDLINNFNDFLKIDINEYETKESTTTVAETITSTAERDEGSSEKASSEKADDETTRASDNTSYETVGSSFGSENSSKPESSSAEYTDYVTSVEEDYDSGETEGTIEEPYLEEEETESDKEETSSKEEKSKPDEEETGFEEEDSKPDEGESEPDESETKLTTTHESLENNVDGNESKPDGISTPDEGESTPDEGELTPDEKYSTPDGEETNSYHKWPSWDFWWWSKATHKPDREESESDDEITKPNEQEHENNELRKEEPISNFIQTPIEDIVEQSTTYIFIEDKDIEWPPINDTESKPDEGESEISEELHNFEEGIDIVPLVEIFIYNHSHRIPSLNKLTLSFPKFNIWGFWWVEATTTHTPIMDVVSEICESCTYWIIAPSAVCMVLSIKIGLVWMINIATAVSLIYLGKIAKLTPSLLFSPNFG